MEISLQQLDYLIRFLRSFKIIGNSEDDYNEAWNTLKNITVKQKSRFYAIPKEELKTFYNQLKEIYDNSRITAKV